MISLFFEDDGARPQQIAKTFKTTKGNMSHCLASLESKRFVKRHSIDNDQRSFLFLLTENGKEKALKQIAYFNDSQNQLEKEFGDDKVKDFIQAIHFIQKATD